MTYTEWTPSQGAARFCTECGCLVVDEEAHDRIHKALNVMLAVDNGPMGGESDKHR